MQAAGRAGRDAARQEILRQTRTDPAHKGLIRWAIDVDPLTI
jgi:primosomal protein N' (replication factor Y)